MFLHIYEKAGFLFTRFEAVTPLRLLFSSFGILASKEIAIIANLHNSDFSGLNAETLQDKARMDMVMDYVQDVRLAYYDLITTNFVSPDESLCFLKLKLCRTAFCYPNVFVTWLQKYIEGVTKCGSIIMPFVTQ